MDGEALSAHSLKSQKWQDRVDFILYTFLFVCEKHIPSDCFRNVGQFTAALLLLKLKHGAITQMKIMHTEL